MKAGAAAFYPRLGYVRRGLSGYDEDEALLTAYAKAWMASGGAAAYEFAWESTGEPVLTVLLDPSGERTYRVVHPPGGTPYVADPRGARAPDPLEGRVKVRELPHQGSPSSQAFDPLSFGAPIPDTRTVEETRRDMGLPAEPRAGRSLVTGGACDVPDGFRFGSCCQGDPLSMGWWVPDAVERPLCYAFHAVAVLGAFAAAMYVLKVAGEALDQLD